MNKTTFRVCQCVAIVAMILVLVFVKPGAAHDSTNPYGQVHAHLDHNLIWLTIPESLLELPDRVEALEAEVDSLKEAWAPIIEKMQKVIDALDPPVVATIDPTVGTSIGGTLVNVYGSGFDPAGD